MLLSIERYFIPNKHDRTRFRWPSMVIITAAMGSRLPHPVAGYRVGSIGHFPISYSFSRRHMSLSRTRATIRSGTRRTTHIRGYAAHWGWRATDVATLGVAQLDTPRGDARETSCERFGRRPIRRRRPFAPRRASLRFEIAETWLIKRFAGKRLAIIYGKRGLKLTNDTSFPTTFCKPTFLNESEKFQTSIRHGSLRFSTPF